MDKFTMAQPGRLDALENTFDGNRFLAGIDGKVADTSMLNTP